MKRSIAGLGMRLLRNGTVDAGQFFKLLMPVDRLLSRRLSSAGRYLRRSQMKFLAEALDCRNLRAWTSVFFPAELLHAFGILPLSLEILSGILSTVGLSREFLDASQGAGMPPSMCSFHRLLIGLTRSGYFAPPKFVAASSLLCDGNLKSFSEVARECGVEFFYLDVPCREDDHSITYLREQLEYIARRFASLCGKEFSPEACRMTVRKADRGIQLLHRLWKKRMSSGDTLFRGHEMANFCFPSHYLLGSDRLIDTAGGILRKMSIDRDHHKYYPSSKLSAGARRLMWMHIVPQYDTGIWDLLDNGVTAKIVCEEYAAPYYEGYDPDDPFGSIARRLIRHPSNGALDRRLENALRIAADFRVDGVVHYSSWGCHQAAGNVPMLEREFERKGYPFLNLNGDAVDAGNTTFEQHRTRIEAFLEKGAELGRLSFQSVP